MNIAKKHSSKISRRRVRLSAPTRSVLNWDDLRFVLAIATARSLSGAARALGVRHSTVFRRIGAIEHRLALRLFERRRDGYVPTAAGEEAARAAATVEATALDIERRLIGRDLKLSGTIRIATADTILTHLLAPVLPSFRAQHADIHLEFDIANEYANLTQRDADVAIRATLSPPPNLVGRKICDAHAALYVARGQRVRGGAAAVATLDWIGFDDRLGQSTIGRWLAEQVPDQRTVVRVNSIIAMARLAEDGAGAAALPCFVGDASPGLERLTPPVPALRTELWLLTHRDLRAVARIKAFMTFIGEQLTDQRSRIEGRIDARARR